MWTLFQNCNARQAYLHYFMQNFYFDQRYLQKLSFKTHGNCFCFLFWKKKFGFLQFMTLINPWTTYKHKAIFKCIIWCYKANSLTSNLSNPFLTKLGLFTLNNCCVSCSMKYLKQWPAFKSRLPILKFEGYHCALVKMKLPRFAAAEGIRIFCFCRLNNFVSF